MCYIRSICAAYHFRIKQACSPIIYLRLQAFQLLLLSLKLLYAGQCLVNEVLLSFLVNSIVGIERESPRVTLSPGHEFSYTKESTEQPLSTEHC